MRKVAFALAICAAPLAATAQTLTIAALGDSLTAGYGLPVQDGLVPQLETWLKSRGHDVKLVNAGVSGDTTRGGLARTDWTLTPDVGAMIVALGGNDVLRGLDPSSSRANLEGILKKAAAKGVPVLLIGVRAPPNYGPDYKTSFDGMYPDLSAKYGTLLYEDFFKGLLEGTDRASALAKYMQADGIHPNAAGVSVLVAKIGPSVEKLIDRAE
jgi:acyl-CoA thioesterase-1